MRAPNTMIVNDPDRLLSWLNDLWKLVELNSCKIKVGTYTGDGSTGQAITGLGFQPKYVKIWPRPSAEADMIIMEKVDDTWGDYAAGHIVTATHEHYSLDNRINSFDSDGFSVDDDGADSHPNKNSQVYSYLALA